MKLLIDKKIYSLDAVKKSAYRFIDRLTILITQDDENIVLEIDGIGAHAANQDTIIADFKRELLDQDLRIKINKETEPVRNLILSYAFSQTGLQE
jgi:His-Xaa-Ser system protein HxsD